MKLEIANNKNESVLRFELREDGNDVDVYVNGVMVGFFSGASNGAFYPVHCPSVGIAVDKSGMLEVRYA